MARTVASLSVSINAKTSGLSKGLKGATDKIKKFSGQVAKTAASVAKLAGGIATAGAAVGTFAVGKAIKSLSDLGKTADKLSIDPTALIAIRDAAEESGVAVNTTDMALQRMLRRIQEAAQGKGEAKSVLKDLALDAEKLSKMKPEEQLIAIARAMAAGAEDGVDLSRAMKLFDSEGVAMINTLRTLNEKGLKQFVENVERSGRAVSRMDLKPMEDIEDRFTRLGNRMQGVFIQLAKAISPLLDGALKRLEEFLDDPASVEKMQQAFKDMASSIQSVVKQVSQLLDNWREMKNFLGMSIDDKISQTKNIASGITAPFRATGTAVGGLANAVVNPGNGSLSRAMDESLDIFKEGISDWKRGMSDAAEDMMKVFDFATEGKDSGSPETVRGLEKIEKAVRETAGGASRPNSTPVLVFP